jgi:hypothetical protein
MDNFMDIEGFQSIIVSKDNNIIFQYGDITYNKGYLASCRKSILAILYGMYDININKTLEELDIDDKTKLSKTEKSATIKNLLSARSGIYHHASNESDDKYKPERHSKKPGEHFVYNNWDFNVLGTIFEKETGLTIYDALNDFFTVNFPILLFFLSNAVIDFTNIKSSFDITKDLLSFTAFFFKY